MRRILRKIASDCEDFGDISTLADPSVVEDIINRYKLSREIKHWRSYKEYI